MQCFVVVAFCNMVSSLDQKRFGDTPVEVKQNGRVVRMMRSKQEQRLEVANNIRMIRSEATIDVPAASGQRTECTGMAFAGSVLEYPPHAKGGEMHFDLREELKLLQPGLAREILEFMAPRPDEASHLSEAAEYDGVADVKPGAKCTVSRFVQYAMCNELMTSWAPHEGNWTALSFGGNGYDDWSDHVRNNFAVVPEVFDCYDPTEIAGTVMHPDCIGGQARRQQEIGKHSFIDLNIVLNGQRDASVLIKLDIESQEFDVLDELTDNSLRTLGYITVEYHFLGEYGTRCCGLDKLKQIVQRLSENFLVIDSSAMRWGDESDCHIDGYTWPTAISVSYIARKFLLM